MWFILKFNRKEITNLINANKKQSSQIDGGVTQLSPLSRVISSTCFGMETWQACFDSFEKRMTKTRMLPVCINIL